ncbi:putative helix-loop-helix DNA-binding domain-containing protein [Neofusicoccum parvum]|uniref:BHLH domain-containing protein n=3 Tax=Neofusicoccum TaxID=407951 RepID=A0ABR3SY29_9PEZI|nr:putative helix-loop-helix dna-binding domain-containing protein [Neofusicoccum parvum UCRNP2]GME24855.1 putative helix-loop-helix DNA-binding domain-containing protein [Neofusicoccum parvum]GME37384.1 putative helix-loop-helix DNA-binding domain-containing protein [Neofusicoccum parvum]
MSTSPPVGAKPAAGQPEKPRLTEEEKKNNHIASEQKRRQAIRQGFDRLASIVPGMDGQGRSEAIVLDATVKYMREQYAEQQRLVECARAKGIDPASIPGLPENYKETLDTQVARDAAAFDEATNSKRKHQSGDID